MSVQSDWMPDLQRIPTAKLWCDGNPGTDPTTWDGQEWPDEQECDGHGTHLLDDLVICDKDAAWFKAAGRYPRPIRRATSSVAYSPEVVDALRVSPWGPIR